MAYKSSSHRSQTSTTAFRGGVIPGFSVHLSASVCMGAISACGIMCMCMVVMLKVPAEFWLASTVLLCSLDLLVL